MNDDLTTRAANFLRWKSNFYYDHVEYLHNDIHLSRGNEIEYENGSSSSTVLLQ